MPAMNPKFGTYERDTLEDLCRTAAQLAGANSETARILANATMHAEARGSSAAGLAHFFDYLDGFRCGRINGQASPQVEKTAPGALRVDGQQGLAQVAFSRARGELVETTLTMGVSVLAIAHTFTTGDLGAYARSLTEAGLVAVVTSNSPALMSVGGSPGKVLGTNPMAFGVPIAGPRAVVVDQASSVTAFNNIRSAAERGERLALGCAVDASGLSTQDPGSALAGALLPFGGYKGGNIAFLVEFLASMAGASWAVDAPAFDTGDRNPDVGMVVVAIDPARFSADFSERAAAYLDRISTEFGVDTSHLFDRAAQTHCRVAESTYVRLLAEGRGPSSGR